MENSNIIFKNENLEIFWQVGSTPANGEAKGVKVNCSATNPHDGNDYQKYAGWLGKSLALHGGAKTQGYIYEKACELIAENASEILTAIISFLEKQKQVDIHPNGWETKTSFASQLEAWKIANSGSAGNGVAFKISHPLGEGQRNAVREIMQASAPIGTQH
jgi:hypothetical protein